MPRAGTLRDTGPMLNHPVDNAMVQEHDVFNRSVEEEVSDAPPQLSTCRLSRSQLSDGLSSDSEMRPASTSSATSSTTRSLAKA